MISTRTLRKAKVAALTTLLAGGTLFSSMCTAKDIQKNLVAGSLGYVKSGATSFWSNLVPQEPLWDSFFDANDESQ